MSDVEALSSQVEEAKRAIFAQLTGALVVRQRRRRARRALVATMALAIVALGLLLLPARRDAATRPRQPEWFSFASPVPSTLVEVVRAPRHRLECELIDDRRLIAEFAKDGDVVGIVRTENRVLLVGR